MARRVLGNGTVLTRVKNPNGAIGYSYFVEPLCSIDKGYDCGTASILAWDSSSISIDILSACIAWELDKDKDASKGLKKEFNME